MKKLLLLFTMSIVVLLAGCMAEQEPQHIESTVYDKLLYSTSRMSYSNTSSSDILYYVDNTYFDYIILNERVMENNLTLEEASAYESLFIVLDKLNSSSSFSYPDIDDFNTQDFKDLSTTYDIQITMGDIVTYNALKTSIPNIKATLKTRSSSISKIDYMELMLGRTLTNDEVTSLELLQTNYNELYQYDFVIFDFRIKSLEDLLFEFETKISYVPTESELTQLQIAYDIVTELINH